MEQFFHNPATIWLLVAFGTLLAPLFEEILFRGFLLPAIAIAVDWLRLPRHPALDPSEALSHLDTWRASESFSVPALLVASILTSLFFALIHAPQLGYTWPAIALLAAVSLVLCYVRLRTRSVAASTFIHASYNFSVFITLFITTGGFRHLEPSLSAYECTLQMHILRYLSCIITSMANATSSKGTYRKVLLLREDDKKQLQRLSRQEKVSASEIMRRSLHSYSASDRTEEQEMKSLFAEMNRVLDTMLDTVRSARIEVAENNLKIRQIREAQG